MPTPQPAVLPPGNLHAYFLILRVPQDATRRDAQDSARRAASALSKAQSTAAEIAGTDARARLVMNVGIGAEMWDRLSPGRRPKGLRPFKEVGSGALHAPATHGDLFVHIASTRHDLNFQLAHRLVREIGSPAQVLEDVHGFRYLDTRDLTGFIDGTENPQGDERTEVAIIGDEDAAFAGGSYVATMRFVHRLDAWNDLDRKRQEGIVGRTKPDSIELPDDVKPPTSHVSRVVIEKDGEELQILRQSYPYGDTREAGLFFVAYGRTLDHFEMMLARMYGVSGDGLHDHLMDFTHAVSGATFFVPSVEVLGGLS